MACFSLVLQLELLNTTWYNRLHWCLLTGFHF
ncbi:hypothetical protein T4A_8097 [Trichinella pseudospiralis]|uniref:Uncharacterized protein n=1 Tax=Trichinella pseudospiralis TaxID=6337 RepID=A0A0V1AM99_TRIPS|nr:hypothetical protein T4A_8097 [Trichinella pseudospiralis]